MVLPIPESNYFMAIQFDPDDMGEAAYLKAFFKWPKGSDRKVQKKSGKAQIKKGLQSQALEISGVPKGI
jgi:hypothetical protein